MTKKKKQRAEVGPQPEATEAATGGAQAAPVAEVGAGSDAPADLYSLRQLAGLLGVDRHRLAERVRDIESFQGPHGSRLYSLSAVEEVLAEDPDPDIREARLRKLRAEAGLAELKLQKERGEVVNYRDLLSDHLEILRDFYTRFTVTVPQRLGPRLRVATTAREAEEILRVELGREFQEVRAEHVRRLAGLEEVEGQQEKEAHDDER